MLEEPSRCFAESKSLSGRVSRVCRSKAEVITAARLVITAQDGGRKETPAGDHLSQDVKPSAMIHLQQKHCRFASLFSGFCFLLLPTCIRDSSAWRGAER